MTTPNPFVQSIFNETPELPFFQAIQPFATSPARQSFFGSQFRPTRNLFSGELANRIQSQGPTVDFSFTDFLKDFDFNNRFRQQSRSSRGAQSNLFNPSTRFLFQGF